MTAQAVECTGLVHRFGDTVAVDHLDLSIPAGEVFGLLGPNGAGKTTTIRVLNTLLPVQEGSVRVFGFHTPIWPGQCPGRWTISSFRPPTSRMSPSSTA